MVVREPGFGADNISWVRFGKAARPHGVRGELRIIPDDVDFELPASMRVVRLRPSEGAANTMEVESCRAAHRALLLKLRGVADRDAAAAWAGAIVELDSTCLPACAAGEFYFYELVGSLVQSAATGASLGTLRRVVSNAGQPLAVIQASGEQELWLPLVPEHIVRFDRGADRSARVLVVEVPEGLWEDES